MARILAQVSTTQSFPRKLLGNVYLCRRSTPQVSAWRSKGFPQAPRKLAVRLQPATHIKTMPLCLFPDIFSGSCQKNEVLRVQRPCQPRKNAFASIEISHPVPKGLGVVREIASTEVPRRASSSFHLAWLLASAPVRSVLCIRSLSKSGLSLSA